MYLFFETKSNEDFLEVYKIVVEGVIINRRSPLRETPAERESNENFF